MKAQGRGLPHTSQVLVEHPEQFLQHIKQCLSSKEGIPVKQQRLVFSGPGAQLLGESQESSQQQPAVEEILSSLNQWQAIIFQNGRAIGRSVNLKLYSCTLPESSLYKSEESLAIECFALQLDAWHPSWKARTEDSSPLYIAVDEDFKKSSFHVQLIGRTSRGTNFALPFAYKFEGSAVCSRLDYYDQHVKRHQQSFASLHDTEVSGEYNIKFGEGLQSFTAVLDVVDQPHWLKSFVLHFSVLVASKLDDQAEPSVSRAVSPQHSEAPGMAVSEQPSENLLLSGAESMQSQNGHSIAPASRAELDKATDQGWLPAKLLPPKSDSSGRQKQPKKRSKQKMKAEAESTQKADAGQPAKKGAHDLSSCKPAHAGDSKWELQHADCMDEAANGKAFSDDSAEDHTCRMEGSFPEATGPHQNGSASKGEARHAKQREDSTATGGATSKLVPQPVTAVPSTAVRWRPSNPAGVKIRAGQGSAAAVHPAPVQQKYVHPNAGGSGRSGFTEDLLSPGRRSGSVWRGGHSSVSSLVVDTAVGDESSSWQSLSEGSDRSTSSEVDMISPVSVGKRDAPKKPMAGPGPGQPPRAIPNSPGSVSSQCGPPLDQLLPSQVKNATPEALSPDTAEPAAVKGSAGGDSHAVAGAGESKAKPSGPFRVLSMNSDRSHGQQEAVRSAAAPPAAPVKVQKLQQASQPMAEGSYKAAPKLLVQVRADAPRSSSVALQPGSKPKSLQKRSTPPSAPASMAYAPSHTPAPVLAWPHVQQQQRSTQMHAPPSMGMTSMDTQLMLDVQRQVSAADMAAYSASMRAPVRTQSLPRLQQDARDGTKMQQQQRQAGQSGPFGQMSEAQRQAIMQQMARMPPSWHQSQQSPVEALQPLPKQAAAQSAGTRAPPAGSADMHAQRRHSVPASPVMGPHSGPFAFHPHSEPQALHQLMQQALSHNGFSSQGQPPRSMGLPAGQMLGHPAMRPRPSPYAEPSLQRQMHVPMVPSSQTVLGMPQLSQPSDIERFLSLTTPTLPTKIGAVPTLAHLWSFYDQASVFGKEVHTTGGSRGPSRAFFVPSLSAMQLFMPADSGPQSSASLHTLSDAVAAQYPMWPKRMRVLKEVFEAAKPYERPALAQRIEQLVAEPCADGQPGTLLRDMPLQQLHPASWFCVAWYPVYRIPDAPLTAKFLTYHSVAPVPCAATHYGAVGLAPPRNGHACQPGTPLCLPIIGLKCANLSDASWVDPLPGVPDGPVKGLMRTPSLGSSSEDSSAATSFEDFHSSAKSAGVGAGSASAAWEGPESRRSRLMELSLCADWLSRREAFNARKGMQAQHDDHSFFSRNADKSIVLR